MPKISSCILDVFNIFIFLLPKALWQKPGHRINCLTILIYCICAILKKYWNNLRGETLSSYCDTHTHTYYDLHSNSPFTSLSCIYSDAGRYPLP